MEKLYQSIYKSLHDFDSAKLYKLADEFVKICNDLPKGTIITTGNTCFRVILTEDEIYIYESSLYSDGELCDKFGPIYDNKPTVHIKAKCIEHFEVDDRLILKINEDRYITLCEVIHDLNYTGAKSAIMAKGIMETDPEWWYHIMCETKYNKTFPGEEGEEEEDEEEDED